MRRLRAKRLWRSSGTSSSPTDILPILTFVQGEADCEVESWLAITIAKTLMISPLLRIPSTFAIAPFHHETSRTNHDLVTTIAFTLALISCTVVICNSCVPMDLS